MKTTDHEIEARPKLELEAEPAEDARRRDLIRDLAMRGGFADRRLRDLVHDRLGAVAWSDEALKLLDELLRVMARGSDDEQA